MRTSVLTIIVGDGFFYFKNNQKNKVNNMNTISKIVLKQNSQMEDIL